MARATDRLGSQRPATTGELDAMVADLARVEDEQRRYAAAIATDGDLSVLTEALKDRARERQR